MTTSDLSRLVRYEGNLDGAVLPGGFRSAQADASFDSPSVTAGKLLEQLNPGGTWRAGRQQMVHFGSGFVGGEATRPPVVVEVSRAM